jgi:CubicO group peptidase (beta-lactamase class C family)
MFTIAPTRRRAVAALAWITVSMATVLNAPTANAQPADDLAKTIDATIAPHFKPDEPGAAVIVVKDGKTIFRKAYGTANIEKGVALDPQMPFRLGSITKQFTATGILMLAEQGKLAVTDDLTRYLPDYPTHGKKITLEHLLTHTSGIRSYTDMPGFGAIMQKDMTVQQMIDFFKNEPLQFEPGERYAYSNSGYFLLGAIIEKVSGMSYAAFMSKHIFEPLGMNDTAYEGHERTAARRVEGYARGKNGFFPAAAISMTQPYAAGALISTVDDLARWDAAIREGKLLTRASWEKAFTPFKLNNGQTTAYGYGWSLRKLRGHAVIDHGGGINGFVTHAMRLPNDNLYIAVLMNHNGREPGPNYVADEIAAIAIGKPYPVLKAIALDARTLDQYEGTYRVDEKSNRVVTRIGDQLFLQRGASKIPMQPYAENEFFLPNVSFTRYRFIKDETGKVTQMKILLNDETEEINPRIGDKPAERKSIALAPERFDRYVGEYQFSPTFSIVVSRMGERFLTQATGQGAIEIFAENESTFFTKVVDAQLQFEKDADGNVTQLVLTQNGRRNIARKIR